MDEILYQLCRHCVGIMDGWHPYPAWCIARTLNMSVGHVRYHLRKLKEKGLVSSFYEGGQTEDGEVFCYWGWTVTEKAYSTEEYIRAHNEERAICNECFQIDIGETHTLLT